MKWHSKFTVHWIVLATGTTLLLLWLAACGVLEDIGQRPVVTNTFTAPRTATFGGRISVWMVSPTGQPLIPRSTTPDPTRGEVVGPVGTATAIFNTFATQTAIAAESNPPNFQTADCPLPSGRVPEPPPDTFAEFPSAIGAYLSDGGPTAVLESELRVWGAITERGGVVQADTDLTGDRVPEIIINLYNPFLYNPEAIINAGQLLVYGCDNGAYRLLYQTPNSPGLVLPVLHRVGDMNGDVKAELVFDIQSCSQVACTREGYVLTWNSITGAFDQLNNASIIAMNGRLGVVDIDSDGILEITVASNPPSDITSGPRRPVVDIWDWTGKNYVLAVQQQDDPVYRIHVLHDADNALQRQLWQSALSGYREVRSNETLLAWTIPSEREILRGYATYRLVIVYARLRDGRAETMLNALLAENPEGTPGAVYGAMANAYMENFRAGGNISTACQAALAVASARPEALTTLNSYGYANPIYSWGDLCPF